MPITSHAFEQTWQRMLSAINTRTDSGLAKFLAISPAGVSSAKSKQRIPQGWFNKICQETGISRSWLVGDEPIEKHATLNVEIPETLHPKTAPTCPTPPTPEKIRTATSFNVAEIISQAIEVLESDTVFSNALITSIQAFHKAMCAEKQINDFNAEMLTAFTSFQKRQDKQ